MLKDKHFTWIAVQQQINKLNVKDILCITPSIILGAKNLPIVRD